MSKSLGNLVMVRDLLQNWPADALRVYLVSHHYRQVWSYSQDELEQAGQIATRLIESVRLSGGMGESLDYHPHRLSFLDALDDDLDTQSALLAVENLAREIQDAAQAGQDVQRAQAELRELGGVLGLRLDEESAEPGVIAGWNKHLQRFQ
jgi:cysteinyl-tRNA synthetase